MALPVTARAWTAEPYDRAAAVRLQENLGLGAAASAILVRRGHADPVAAREFLAAGTRTDPHELPGVPGACELILRHVGAGSRILVFGDYDVDGVCSTAMMIRTLRALGADPVWQLPSRAEGYGLTTDAVERIAGYGTQLLITVDCGITSIAEVARAKQLGVEVLVTDHHRPGPELPDCPIVHPALGSAGQQGPAGELCAAGVVLKLSEALRAAAGLDPAGAEEDLDLAGLATVCDMVPLRGENRRIAREGMAAVARTVKPGLRALMKVADLEAGEVNSRTAGFRLGPRINAAGRLQRADAALELMLTDDEDRAREVAQELDGLNHDRRETEQRILHAAEAACADQMSAAVLVVAGEDWHAGVVGIVASRLVERFHRPAVVIALDGDEGRGSGRSIPSYDLHAGLTAVSGDLLGYGGHKMAAGLQIEADRVPDLRRALAAHAGARLTPADLRPVQHVDAVVPGGALTLETAEELERLGPFGAGNPAPKLLIPAARIEHVTAMGEERKHARFSLVGGGARARGVAFRRTQRSLAAAGAHPHDVTVSLERNRWNGTVEARVLLESLSPARPGTLHDIGSGEFWEKLEAELHVDASRWWPPMPVAICSARAVYDRHGEGVAAIAGELLSGGEAVLLVVADVARRQAGLEQTIAGMAPDGLAVISWAALGRQPSLAQPFDHLVAVDPPPVAEGVQLLGAAPGGGAAHLAWGPAERDFALAHGRAQLSVRDDLATLWRVLSAQDGLDGTELHEALQGSGAYPREVALAARLLLILREIDLIELDMEAREVVVVSTERKSLESSATFRACGVRLAALERYLGSAREAAAA